MVRSSIPRSGTVFTLSLLLALVVGGLALLFLSAQSVRAQATQDENTPWSSANKKVNSAKGKGQQNNTGFTTKFAFKGKNLDSASDAAKGKVSFKNSNGTVIQSGKGDIQCLRAVKYFGGTKAGYFVFLITESSGAEPVEEGTPIGVNIVDTGKKNGRGDELMGAPVGVPGENPPCEDPSVTGMPLAKGNIDIKAVGPQLPG
jgi:hypothetical protein